MEKHNQLRISPVRGKGTSGKRVLGMVLAAMCLVLSPQVNAGWKPDGVMTLQIGFGAGGSTDTMGRVLAKVMKDQTGWNIIAENKTGGGGVAMFTGIAKMPPRGKVIGLGVNMPILVNLVRRGDELGFDLDSFEYLGTISKAELALVASAEAPFDDLDGLIAHAKSAGSLPVAYGAPPQKLLMDVASRESGASFDMVTTKGGAETMKLILGGQVMAGFSAGEHFPAAGGVFGVMVMLVFAALGYLMAGFGYPLVIVIIAFFLGPRLEVSIAQSLALTRGDPVALLDHPVAIALLILSVVAAVYLARRTGHTNG